MLEEIKKRWGDLICKQLGLMLDEAGAQKPDLKLTPQTPPSPEMGDIAFALFAYAKSLKRPPQAIASQLKARIEALPDRPQGQIICLGPYLNIKIDTGALALSLSKEIEKEKSSYGCSDLFKDKKIMVEFSCPNTNKPLHLGHVRNDSIGNSVSEILKANGAKVMKVNLINDRGVHICKSMLAYLKFGHGQTPQSEGIKGDHFVGDYYVKYAEWEKTDPSAPAQAQQMLEKWEEGDPFTLELWNKMNSWALEGLRKTYQDMRISFDKYYYESKTYKLGKQKVLDGLKKGIFFQEQDGSVWADLSKIKLDRKVLLRKDGTSLYITQDIGTAISRREDWPFDSLIYVVASEQRYHFKVLFYILKMLGYEWASGLKHLAYGMVFLPEGKMKSREGTVVDADDLLSDLVKLAKEEIKAKGREEFLDDVQKTAKDIALGALNYYLLQFDPMRDIVFNPKESISFAGNTGPYLQYTGARISSMLRKFEDMKPGFEDIEFDPGLLCVQEEREIIKLLARYPETVKKAGENLDPALICAFLYDLAKLFSGYYHDNQVLKAGTKALIKARVKLCQMVLQVLKNAFSLVGIPFLEKM